MRTHREHTGIITHHTHALNTHIHGHTQMDAPTNGQKWTANLLCCIRAYHVTKSWMRIVFSNGEWTHFQVQASTVALQDRISLPPLLNYSLPPIHPHPHPPSSPSTLIPIHPHPHPPSSPSTLIPIHPHPHPPSSPSTLIPIHPHPHPPSSPSTLIPIHPHPHPPSSPSTLIPIYPLPHPPSSSSTLFPIHPYPHPPSSPSSINAKINPKKRLTQLRGNLIPWERFVFLT